MFEITFNDKEVTKIEVAEKSKAYFENLNVTKWLAAVKKYAESILQEQMSFYLQDHLIFLIVNVLVY